MLTRAFRPFLALPLSLCLLAIAAPDVRAAADDELVENPAYKSWSAMKPGSTVTFDNRTTLGAQNIKVTMIQKLLELTPEKAVVEVTTKIDMAGAPTPPGQKQDIPAKVKKSEATPGKLPEGVKGEVKDKGTEKLTISGKSYECKVYEFTGEQNGMTMTGKMWTTDKIPGMMAKLESSGKIADQAMKTTMTVSKIESK